MIANNRPDMVGVQEALRFQLDEIAAEFPRLGEVGVGREDGDEAGEYSAILYDEDRLELVGSDTFWLSDAPEVVASTSWGNRIPRIVTWARFRDRRTHRTFYVFNTHWDHESQPSRERSAALLLERIAAREHPDEPVLVTGDFNAGESNPAFTALLEGGRSLSVRPLPGDGRRVVCGERELVNARRSSDLQGSQGPLASAHSAASASKRARRFTRSSKRGSPR